MDWNLTTIDNGRVFAQSGRPMQALIDLFHKIYDVQGIVRVGGLVALVAVIFAETGLLVGFFLPGDSLLFTAGLLSAQGDHLNIVWLNLAVMAAAIVGDTVGYWIGAKSGPKLFTREQSLLFSKKHLLRTQEFYERHGGKTIIMARFMPFVRTFAPVVAGIGKMSYRRFVAYNVFGGIGWVFSMTMLGYILGTAYPSMAKHLDKVIILIILVSLLPGGISYLLNRKKSNPTPAL
jgi:membrane-associated protein